MTRRPEETPLRVLMVSSEWPTPDMPYRAPFLQVLADSLIDQGAKIETVVSNAGKNPLRVLSARRRVRRAVQENDYDVVHVHFGWNRPLVSRSGTPIVFTFHGADLEGTVRQSGSYTWTGRFNRVLTRSAARLSDKVIVVSESLGRRLPAEISYEVVPLGIDLDDFQPAPKAAARRELGLPIDKRLVLFMTHSRPEKRYWLARESMEIVSSAIDASLITLEGEPPDIVARYMNACDLLLVTSAHEGSPMKVKEALASNLPVVSVNVGDVEEWIGALEGCELCPDDSPETIASGIIRVLTRTQPFDGRTTALRADKRSLASRVIEIYHEAISAHRLSQV
jgi:teichuronic acid biosynthesis glycosyltransferase TuaC